MSGMTAPKADQLPIEAPEEADPQWREKVELARQAREMGKKMRKGKPKSFRQAVGKAR